MALLAVSSWPGSSKGTHVIPSALPCIDRGRRRHARPCGIWSTLTDSTAHVTVLFSWDPHPTELFTRNESDSYRISHSVAIWAEKPSTVQSYTVHPQELPTHFRPSSLTLGLPADMTVVQLSRFAMRDLIAIIHSEVRESRIPTRRVRMDLVLVSSRQRSRH